MPSDLQEVDETLSLLVWLLLSELAHRVEDVTRRHDVRRSKWINLGRTDCGDLS